MRVQPTRPLVREDPKKLDKAIKDSFAAIDKVVVDAVAVPNSAEPGFSAIYRNAATPDELIATPHSSLASVYDLFEHAVALHSSRQGFGRRPLLKDGSYGDYEWQTYGDIKQRRDNLGAGIFFVLENNPFRTDSPIHQRCHYTPVREQLNSDQSPVDGSPFVVTIYSHNRPEWVLTDCACVAYSLCSTALYDSLGPETSKYILELTQSPIIICSKTNVAGLIKLKETFPTELANVIAVVSMDKFELEDSSLVDAGKSANIMVYDLEQVEKFGEINPLRNVPPTSESVYTISFTSGTTGANPKGVVLLNRQAVAAVTFCMSQFVNINDPVVYSFLPLAHIYERMSCLFAIFMGCKIGFPQSGSPLSLLDDVKLLRPHVLTLVPRVYSRLEAGIKAQTVDNASSPVIKNLFTRAINKKTELQSVSEGAQGHHIVYDRVTNILRKKLGFDRLVTFTTGSAPIAVETIKFLKASCGSGMTQGYGLTESFAGVMTSPQYENNPGSCGPVAITCEMRLREIPSMGYTANDEGGPRGELLLRGPQIFAEYYKNHEETAKALDEDGWFYTGDVARIDAANSNRVYVIDRVKNYLKLSQGEYVTPERCENLYMATNPALAQIYVFGDSLQNYLVTLIGVDDAVAVDYYGKIFRRKFTSHQEACDFINGSAENKRKLIDILNGRVGDKLQSYEKFKNIEVAINPLGEAGGDFLTPTIKLKRGIAQKHFAPLFDALYKEGNLFDKSKL